MKPAKPYRESLLKSRRVGRPQGRVASLTRLRASIRRKFTEAEIAAEVKAARKA